ncbi:MAG: GNAT family N-acetyltransferase, partial [Candidatus Bathyarchaeia archaeon]
CFFVKEAVEYESIRKFLSKRGYEEKDHLSFMEIAFPSFKSNKSVKVNLIGRDEIDTWCETYLLAFYGDNDLSEPVLKSVKRALMDRKTRFMLARYKDLPVGTLALYETRRFSGAYCVGTIPKFRNIGIASTMLEFAYSLSRKKGKKLVLQTFISDSVESFYL